MRDIRISLFIIGGLSLAARAIEWAFGLDIDYGTFLAGAAVYLAVDAGRGGRA